MIDSSKLASYLASRIFHDLVSPLTALMNGCSLAFDDDMGMSMRAEGEKLIKEGVAGIEAKIQFMRFAVGSQALTDDPADIHVAKSLFDKIFSIHKARLDWRVEPVGITNRQMRVLMNMTLVMMEPAARSGVVTVSVRREGASLCLEVSAAGSPGELKREVLEGLAGRQPEGGWGRGGIQPLFTRLIAEEIGYALQVRSSEAGPVLFARGPAISP